MSNFAQYKRMAQQSLPRCPDSELFSFSPRNPKSLLKGQSVLDIITPKHNTSDSDHRRGHLRLIDDFLRTNSLPLPEPRSSTVNSQSNANENSTSLLFRYHRQGLKVSPKLLSNAVSLCAFDRDLTAGIQIHGFAVTNGFLRNVYVGSSLVSFYSKCGELDSASKVFEEMPERNVVTWTAIMNGFAREGQMDNCLQLYKRMKNSAMKPNAFTFSSFLSACTGNGYLSRGRAVHCQTIQAGFDRCIHVANALISMYCKCGNLEDALSLFREADDKNLVCWNSMIAGYASHGLAREAVELFEKMKIEGMKPDAITFLGVLASCRHAGFVNAGQFYFQGMVQNGVIPDLDHYSCIVDLLGRAGMVEEAMDFIKKMPVSPNAVIWGSLLSSCRLHGNVWVGIEAAENRLELEPTCAATHLQLANLYAAVGYWDQAAKVRKLMRENGLRTDPGCSWIEIKNEIHQFQVEDRSSSNLSEILTLLDCLADHSRDHSSDLFEETYYEVLEQTTINQEGNI